MRDACACHEVGAAAPLGNALVLSCGTLVSRETLLVELLHSCHALILTPACPNSLPQGLGARLILWLSRGRRLSVSLASSFFCPQMERMVGNMWTVLLILLVVWAVLSIVGFVFEGLLWLAIIGIVLFVGTLIFGLLRQRAKRSKA